jgi:hypothetical protein
MRGVLQYRNIARHCRRSLGRCCGRNEPSPIRLVAITRCGFRWFFLLTQPYLCASLLRSLLYKKF